ncbi:YggS family pyridoxal phosphate-dependent enzyme [Lysobacter sp. TLK-CK17T]|uniref:Pyridoxal phosphate homeostasis protein n=1 Tax=Marilutibacter chinensis TaxID=2912247 RepID=A0ABS9HWJ4_9GAMM|nr:YggS family pyridoxal phosphate-dependent enzyme [Lysobacter chinensis]MCF7222497.1 YggS family pyridoxal phosphate-dependent enzyme [Lysobacter chinensis]
MCDTLQRIDNVAQSHRRPAPRLLTVSKTQPARAVAGLATAFTELDADGIPAFGENYVQEAAAKQAELATIAGVPPIEWHLIGHLQSNKAREAATLFDWVQTIDRSKLIAALARHRPAGRTPLNLLIQVNIDDEAGKHGCRPDQVAALAAQIAGHPNLRLRGLMAIPAPSPDDAVRRQAFAAMRECFEILRSAHPDVDTLSMGMSDDYPLAIAEGATMVRIGTALFGKRG